MTEQDYLNRLFIRTYNSQLDGHQHPYHQVLIPLSGSIHLMLETKTVQVNYGEVYIIPKHRYHQFKADQLFRFLVINLEDIDFLPMQHGDEVHDFLDAPDLLDGVSKEVLLAELEEYHRAIALYKNASFKEALLLFEALNALPTKTNQAIYALYCERCEHYIEYPPTEFNGVFVHATKG